jgi:hypothetical protein
MKKMAALVLVLVGANTLAGCVGASSDDGESDGAQARGLDPRESPMIAEATGREGRPAQRPTSRRGSRGRDRWGRTKRAAAGTRPTAISAMTPPPRIAACTTTGCSSTSGTSPATGPVSPASTVHAPPPASGTVRRRWRSIPVGEQMNLGVAPAELREGDAAAPAGEEARIVEVDDIARLRDALGAAQRHVLDMAHDGDARCHAARHSTPE